jgi:hypothetical protein
MHMSGAEEPTAHRNEDYEFGFGRRRCVSACAMPWSGRRLVAKTPDGARRLGDALVLGERYSSFRGKARRRVAIGGGHLDPGRGTIQVQQLLHRYARCAWPAPAAEAVYQGLATGMATFISRQGVHGRRWARRRAGRRKAWRSRQRRSPSMDMSCPG